MASSSSSEIDVLRSYFRRVHEALLFPQSYFTKANASIFNEDSSLVGVAGDSDEISTLSQSGKQSSAVTSGRSTPFNDFKAIPNVATTLRTCNLTPTPSTVVLTNTTKTILFRVERYSWLIEGHNHFHMTEWTGYGPPPVEIKSLDCTVLCDLTTMKMIATGQLRPMNALLTGKVVVKGDKVVFKEYQMALRLAVLSEQYSENFGNRNNYDTNTSTIDPTNKYMKENMYVEIVSVIGLNDGDRNSRFSIEDETASSRMSISSVNDVTATSSNVRSSFLSTRNPSKAVESNDHDDGIDTKGDKVVKYVMQVHDRVRNTQWTIAHRYSDFLNLRRTLLTQSNYALPDIKSPNSYLHSKKTVINQRVISLALFLNETIRIVGMHNSTLNDFLGITSAVCASTSEEVRNGLKSTAMPRSKGKKASSSMPDASSMHAVLNHAFAKKISTLNPHMLQHASYMIDEVKTLQERIHLLEHQGSSDGKQPIKNKKRRASFALVHLYKSIHAMLLFALAYSFYIFYHPFQPTSIYQTSKQVTTARLDPISIEEREVCVAYKDYQEAVVVSQAMNGTFFKYPKPTSDAAAAGNIEVVVDIQGDLMATINQEARGAESEDFVVRDWSDDHQNLEKAPLEEDVVKEDSATPERVCYFIRVPLQTTVEIQTLPEQIVGERNDISVLKISVGAAVLYLMLLALPHLNYHAYHPTMHDFHSAVLVQVFLVFLLAYDIYLQDFQTNAVGDDLSSSMLQPDRWLVWLHQLEAKHVTLESIIQTFVHSTQDVFMVIYKTPIVFLLFKSLPTWLSANTVLVMKVFLHFISMWERVVAEFYNLLLLVLPLSQAINHIAATFSIGYEVVSWLIHTLLVGFLIILLTIYLRYGGRYLSILFRRLYLSVIVVIILAIYTMLSLVCKLSQLSTSKRDQIFTTLDHYLAPFVVQLCLQPYYHGHQQWKASKFAGWLKHFLTHTDASGKDTKNQEEEHAFYWSEIWYEELQHLLSNDTHHSSPEHNGDNSKYMQYVRSIVEEELNTLFELVHDRHTNPTTYHNKLTLEHIFDHFELMPIPSTGSHHHKDALHRVFKARINIYHLHNIRIKAFDAVQYQKKLGATEDMFEYSQLKQQQPSLVSDVSNKLLGRGEKQGPGSLLLALLEKTLQSKQHSTLLDFEYLEDFLLHNNHSNNVENKALLDVAVKVVLPNQSAVVLDEIEEVIHLQQDLSLLQNFLTLLCLIDSHWQSLAHLLHNMSQRLQPAVEQCHHINYINEATMMMELANCLQDSGLVVQCPVPIPVFVSRSMLIMTYLPNTVQVRFCKILIRYFSFELFYNI